MKKAITSSEDFGKSRESRLKSNISRKKMETWIDLFVEIASKASFILCQHSEYF